MRQVHSRHIYVIDSDINDCLMINHTLRQVGFEVSYALDGHKGFATVMAVPPQCLILDDMLPGINGYAILRKIRATYPQSILPIIIISAKHLDIDRNYTLGLGADRYLDKPFTPQQLTQAVWDLMPSSTRRLAETHQLTTSHLPTPENVTRLNVRNLIPFRRERTADILRGSNPFASNADISDLQLRRLYAAIDNHRSIQTLSTMMQLSLQITLALLEKLSKMQYVAFYNTEQHPPELIDFARIRAHSHTLEEM